MPGPPATDHLIIGILYRSTRVSRSSALHALYMRKHRLDSPKASPSYHRRLFPLGGSDNLIHHGRRHRCTRSASRAASQRRRQHRHHHRHHPQRKSGHTNSSLPKSPLPKLIRVTNRKEVSDVQNACFSNTGSHRPPLRALKQTRGGSSEDKPSDVRQVSHSPGLGVRHLAGIEQLGEKPEADQE